ncbi:MAG: alkaline phosphatase family protein [Planctomycetota bacterium]|nr:alkaline phosphatase family protein [Planctomycetota bacterium]
MALSRLLVLQLDSVPWPVLKPLMDAGRAPRLKALYERGCSGTLRSTVPPITPAAWATFMTGVRPGRHGILNFKGFDPRRQSYCVADARHLSERNIYRRLALAGKRVGVAMQPSTHPPFDVNGFCLTGFDSPGLSAPFAHPRELEAEILALCPEHGQNFNLHSLWAKPAREGEDVLPRNLEAAAGQMRRVAKLALDLHARHPVDVLAVYFQAPDVVLHKAWPYCLPEGGQENPARREAVARFFGAMDAACGDLIDGFGGAGRLSRWRSATTGTSRRGTRSSSTRCSPRAAS